MSPVRARAAANAGPMRLSGLAGLGLPRPVGRVAVAEGRDVVLERRADVLVADLEERARARAERELRAFEEGRRAARDTLAPGIAEADAHLDRGVEVIAQARDLETLGS